MFTKTEFVDIRLTEKQRKDFSAWQESAERDLKEHLDSVLLSGHKLSLSYDVKNNTYISALTCRDSGATNDGRCTVSRHNTPLHALLLSLFKHEVICDGADWLEVSTETNWG